MIPRDLIKTFLQDGVDPERGAYLLVLEDGLPNLIAKARRVLPVAFADRLVNEYRMACGQGGEFSESTLNEHLLRSNDLEDVEAFIRLVLNRLKTDTPLKDARAQVTFYAETNSARVVFFSQGYGYGETVCRNAEQLWNCLKKAATDGVDIPAPKPIPFQIETAEEWLKTHRPTKPAQRAFLKTGSMPASEASGVKRGKKPSMTKEQILALDLKF